MFLTFDNKQHPEKNFSKQQTQHGSWAHLAGETSPAADDCITK